MDNRKETERAELHRTIWGIANDLRGSVDGWDFKQYVLGMLFYRYISENLSTFIEKDEHEAGDVGFTYASLPDEDAEQIRADMMNTKGFFILPRELFCNVLKNAPTDENLNETLERAFKNIEGSAQGTESEGDFKGLFEDIDVNSNKLGGTVAKRNERLVKLMQGVAGMQLNNNTIDAFGDAYEFLMGMYASNAGKSGGEYYTPQEVSELLTHLTLVGKTEVNKVYDPACGSGSLLLKFAKILGKENIKQGFCGQEVNITTYNLCRINMFLHDIEYDKFNIAHGDTLTEPQHWDEEPFEAIVSNPPYSIKWEGEDNPLLINDSRFSPAGVLAPKSKADNSTLFIDASSECVKVTNNNKLTQENIQHVLDRYTARENVQYISRLVPNTEVADNGYNLSVSSYVEKEDTREKVDIVALNAEIERIVKREQELRDEIDRIIAELEV